MMTFAEDEVPNIMHRCQKRTEQRPLVTCTENVVKYGHVVLEIRERSDKHTDRQNDEQKL